MSKDGKPGVETAKAFYLALAAGILIITNGVLLGIVANWFIEIMPILPGSSGNDPTLLTELATAGVIFGTIVLFGALLHHFKPQYKKTSGIVIIVFSIPSIIMGGGFIIGFILGILGGKMALPKKSISPPLTKTS